MGLGELAIRHRQDCKCHGSFSESDLKRIEETASCAISIHSSFLTIRGSSPSGVLHHHTEDQLPHLLRRRPSPNRSTDSGDQPPIHAKAAPVPAHNRFRRDDDERLLPLRPQPTDGNPEELVKQIESRPRTTPFQHGQLLTQHEVFDDEIPAATDLLASCPQRWQEF